ncbi:hypothetical protein PPROV_000898700 [Pycnococcus provasolii]|uniref:Aldehyde dehydrogenase domain-containing protein n=1 Tax=Pycnococcus provasolii TaxID=41880 RepID=A0A830HU82_9CHLO|nr:hypothetical protein PPROV_000898700 [Pycnococcus provasolii]
MAAMMSMSSIMRRYVSSSSAAAAAASSSAIYAHREYQPPLLRLPNLGAMIANTWIASSDVMPTINPATEEVIADVTVGRAKEVNAAVEAANEAMKHDAPWRRMGGSGRSRLLSKLADLMEEHAEELAWIDVIDNGKPYGEAFIDGQLCQSVFRYCSGKAQNSHAQLVRPSGPLVTPDTVAYVEREPVGVVGAIAPWNFPLAMATWKLAPALAAGCAVVLKTAPQTPLSANRLAELTIEAGFPPGVVNIMPGDDETGRLLVRHDGVDKISFTGSTEVGKEIKSELAGTFKRLSLELGGKSPLIVTQDADIDRAVDIAQLGLFLNAGQCCCASSRIFVHASRRDEFQDKMKRLAKSRRVVEGWHPDARSIDPHRWPQGPQVDKAQFEKVLGYIESGVRDGANLLCGGKRARDVGYFVEPTIFTDVQDDMAIAREEIFGPVMQIMTYKDDDEVIARANNTVYGLGAGIVTTNEHHARLLAPRIKVGTVWINCYDTFDAALPFGGFKSSGIGRDLGDASLETYTEIKTTVFGAPK